jgi:hypothetical protein
MTLCVAWIREAQDSEELVFATDSTLTGGEKWNHGVKLFELPRRDCLLCFAGETYRAYPLILNLIATIKHNEKLQDPTLDLQEVLYGIAEIFTELVKSIFEKPSGDTSHIGAEAKFLFGGWSWRESKFKIWRLYYSTDAKGFVFHEEAIENKLGKITFLGDPEGDTETGEKNIVDTANKKYKEALIKKERFDGRLDMEPLDVLVDMCRDSSIREVDGAIQIGKIYRSGTNEFFGMMWQSVKGKPTFLGKIYNKHNKPKVKYLDPDTCELLEDDIPKSLVNIQEFSGSDDFGFLESCYSQEDNFLKENISEKEKEKLISIFREHSYSTFLKTAEENLQLKTPVIQNKDE